MKCGIRLWSLRTYSARKIVHKEEQDARAPLVENAEDLASAVAHEIAHHLLHEARCYSCSLKFRQLRSACFILVSCSST